MSTQLLLLYIGGWYLSSISISLFHKWLFDPLRGFHIPYPLLITSLQQITLWICAYIFIKAKHLKDTRKVEQGSSRLKYYLKYILPTAIATGGDIGCSNFSYKYVPLTIVTIIKSSSIAFVLLFGCLFKVERFHKKLLLIVIIMFFGVILMVYDPSHKNEENRKQYSNLLFGCFLVLIGSCLSGLRWVYTQVVLRKSNTGASGKESNINSVEGDIITDNQNEIVIDGSVVIDAERLQVKSIDQKDSDDKPHSIIIIQKLTPSIGVVCLIASLIFEKPFPGFFHLSIFKFKSVIGSETEYITTFMSILRGIALIGLPGVDIFFLTLCEFSILQISQVLTLSVAGIVKEVLTIIFSLVILNERIKGLHSWIGMAVILLDVVYYNYYRYNEKKKDEYMKIIDDRNPHEVPNDDYFIINHEKEEVNTSQQNNQKGSTVTYSIASDPVVQEYELSNLINSSK
ncbi:hypothetical protein TPHA_0D02700 [Tetrapisispora phaffii CBS 4417]|uniref:GDP-mannose transporter n=1 Tax=Tetrapisispora phaffii (strain ATCC 24235 / CBS 4417 / NBRC 1672 / NRRL Y-8282 / UCD 70-5) TaxID=1071381 RepID=G8BST5_TETPH|nr:hypothetical protein TPHA_0D02700 [Tetrapisispora phaffii CBS 4417]CCE62906.1 hypothetical protein TPHA_0D02700 [Tetrapisispora phaffii CBS 4417]